MLPVAGLPLGKALLKFLLGHWREFVIAGLLLVAWHRGNVIESLKREAEGWDNAIQTLKSSIEANEVAYQDCLKVNRLNAEEESAQAFRSFILRDTVLDQEREATAKVEVIYREAHKAQSGPRDSRDTVCRYLADPFPDWFVDELR